jgi:hypothetical protein
MSTTLTANGSSKASTPTLSNHRSTKSANSLLDKVTILTNGSSSNEDKTRKEKSHLSASDALRTKVTLKNNQQMTCLSLLDNDCLKTPTVPDLIKTPTTLGSPTKSISNFAHLDDLNTPRLCLGSGTPKNQGQAFFGDHEPLLTGTSWRTAKTIFLLLKLPIKNYKKLKLIVNFQPILKFLPMFRNPHRLTLRVSQQF